MENKKNKEIKEIKENKESKEIKEIKESKKNVAKLNDDALEPVNGGGTISAPLLSFKDAGGNVEPEETVKP